MTTFNFTDSGCMIIYEISICTVLTAVIWLEMNKYRLNKILNSSLSGDDYYVNINGNLINVVRGHWHDDLVTDDLTRKT